MNILLLFFRPSSSFFHTITSPFLPFRMPTTNRRTPLSSMETANNKPIPEKYQPQLFGMDAELKEKMDAKYDLEMERKAIEWMLEVTGEEVFPGGDDFFLGLRDGVLLCKLLNSIKPGIVKKFNPSPNHVLVERENIQAFLSGCLALGVPSHELFVISDLHEGKDLAAVLRTVYAIGRQAQVTPNFEGPRLGVKYSVTLEEQATRKEKKMKEQYALWLREKEIEEERKNRRDELEKEKKYETIKEMKETERRKMVRQKSKGRMTLDEFRNQAQQLDDKYTQMEEEIDQVEIEVGPILYGMDRETALNLKQKRSSKQIEDDMNTALDWVESMTGETCDDFHESLKSGVVLCRLLNVIRPTIISKIDTRNSIRFGPAVARENIKVYLERCALLGISKTELFSVNDLYEKKNLDGVVRNIMALRRLYGPKDETKKPRRGKQGEDVVITIPSPVEVPQPPRQVFWTRSKVLVVGVVATVVVGGCYIAFSDSDLAQNVRSSWIGNLLPFGRSH